MCVCACVCVNKQHEAVRAADDHVYGSSVCGFCVVVGVQ